MSEIREVLRIEWVFIRPARTRHGALLILGQHRREPGADGGDAAGPPTLFVDSENVIQRIETEDQITLAMMMMPSAELLFEQRHSLFTAR